MRCATSRRRPTRPRGRRSPPSLPRQDRLRPCRWPVERLPARDRGVQAAKPGSARDSDRVFRTCMLFDRYWHCATKLRGGRCGGGASRRARGSRSSRSRRGRERRRGRAPRRCSIRRAEAIPLRNSFFVTDPEASVSHDRNRSTTRPRFAWSWAIRRSMSVAAASFAAALGPPSLLATLPLSAGDAQPSSLPPSLESALAGTGDSPSQAGRNPAFAAVAAAVAAAAALATVATLPTPSEDALECATCARTCCRRLWRRIIDRRTARLALPPPRAATTAFACDASCAATACSVSAFCTSAAASTALNHPAAAAVGAAVGADAEAAAGAAPPPPPPRRDRFSRGVRSGGRVARRGAGRPGPGLVPTSTLDTPRGVPPPTPRPPPRRHRRRRCRCGHCRGGGRLRRGRPPR